MTLAPNSLEGRALALAERIEALQIQVEKEQEQCREACMPMRQDIAEVWKRAKGGDFSLEALRAHVKVRAAQRKALAKLTPTERDAYRNLRDAMGPLGEAAARQAGFDDDATDVRPRFARGSAN